MLSSIFSFNHHQIIFNCLLLEIKEKDIDWQQVIFKELSGSRTLSGDFMERVIKGHYNKFECGSKVEVCDKRQNFSMCVATIEKIVGDRLCLRYDGVEDGSEGDHWTHYLSSDIHPVGWSQLVGLALSPPYGKNPLNIPKKLFL